MAYGDITRAAGGHIVYEPGGHMVYKAVMPAYIMYTWRKNTSALLMWDKNKSDIYPLCLGYFQDSTLPWYSTSPNDLRAFCYWVKASTTYATCYLWSSSGWINTSAYTDKVLKKIRFNCTTYDASTAPAKGLYVSLSVSSETAPVADYSWIASGTPILVTGTGSTLYDLGAGITMGAKLWLTAWIEGDFEPPDTSGNRREIIIDYTSFALQIAES